MTSNVRMRSSGSFRRGLGDLAFPLALDIRTRDANADLLLELDDEHAVVGNAGDLADQAAACDDLVALAQLAEHRLMVLLSLHLRTDQDEVEDSEHHEHHQDRLHGGHW